MYHVSEIQRLPFRERGIGSAVVVSRAPGDRFTTMLFVLSWAEIVVSAVIASPRNSVIAPLPLTQGERTEVRGLGILKATLTHPLSLGGRSDPIHLPN
jgi:hypothetical protein